MKNIEMIRVDFRLIHGQVVTKWIKQTTANKIIIIDDLLVNDDFMASIYVMAAPPGIKVEVQGTQQVAERYKNGEFDNDKLFVLFRDIPSVYKSYNAGFPIEKLQIGGLGAGPGRKTVFGPITLDKSDVEMLKNMTTDGVYIYLHQVPDDPHMDFQKIIEKKIFSN